MVNKLILLFISIFAFSVNAKRTQLTVDELKKIYPVVLVGYVLSENENESNILVLKHILGASRNNFSIQKELPGKKPNENVETAKVYLFFLKPKKEGLFEVGRSVEIDDFLIGDSQLNLKSIKDTCKVKSLACLFHGAE